MYRSENNLDGKILFCEHAHRLDPEGKPGFH